MEMNTQITLVKIREPCERYQENQTETVLTVWGVVQIPSSNFRFNAANAGMTVDFIIHLWRHEFEQDDFNYVDIDNVRYRIESSNASVNDQFVKLLVSRG